MNTQSTYPIAYPTQSPVLFLILQSLQCLRFSSAGLYDLVPGLTSGHITSLVVVLSFDAHSFSLQLSVIRTRHATASLILGEENDKGKGAVGESQH